MSLTGTPLATSRLPGPQHVRGRFFIVGCARGGTTLLQSFVAAHPDVHSFPETGVFQLLIGGEDWRNLGRAAPLERCRQWLRARLDRPYRDGEQAYGRALAFLKLHEVNRPELATHLPPRTRSMKAFAAAFAAVLDRMTLECGKSCWLEKTPGNLGYVEVIRRLVPGARFINILREGRLNVASLYEMSIKFPDRPWWARYRNFDLAVDRWNTCVRNTRRLMACQDHFLVRFEKLLGDPHSVMRDLCAFMELPYRPEMVEKRGESVAALVRPNEPWKAGVFAPVQPAAEDKFEKLLTAAQRERVLARLERVDF